MSARRWILATGVVVLAVVLAFARAPSQKPYSTWSDYGGSPDSMQYSSLTEITTTNVSQLELAWFYPVPDRKGNFGFNPLIVGDVMYLLGRGNAIVAVDAVSGTEIWSRRIEGGSPGNRGINYWESADRSDRRLIDRHRCQGPWRGPDQDDGESRTESDAGVSTRRAHRAATR